MTHLTFLNHDRCTTSPIAELWLPDISPIARFRYIRLYNQNSCKSEKILLQATATTIVYHQRTVNLLLTALICIRTARVTQIPGCQPMRQVRQPRRYDTLGFSHRRSTCVGPQFCRWLAGCRRGRFDNALKPPVANVRHFLFMFVSFSASGYKNINLPTPVKRQST